MALLGIIMFNELISDIFGLVPFGGARGISCRL